MSNLIEQFQTTTDLKFFLENYPEEYNETLVDTICKTPDTCNAVPAEVPASCATFEATGIPTLSICFK